VCIGTVDLIKNNNVDVQTAGPGAEVSVQVRAHDWSPIAGKDFKAGDKFVSRMNREIIDLLKAHFRDEIPKEEWGLIVEIKKILHID
jgi:translation initiation factor IF-2